MSQNGPDSNQQSARPCTCRNDRDGMGEIPSGDWSKINQAADDFERAWKTGPRPAIEDYLAGTAEPRRKLLLHELLRVERELRLRDGEDPGPEDYRDRLPGDWLVVEAAFRGVARSRSAAGDDASGVAGTPATASFIPTIQRGVLAGLVETVGPTRPVLLRDTWPGDGNVPMVLPSSSEMPALHDEPGRLQLFGEIARGGMGAILKGHDPDLGRDLAVKVLLDSHRDNPELVLRFIEEAQIAGQLQHPGVVPVYELGQFADCRPYFSMKLVRGRTLAEALRDRLDPAHELSTHVATWLQICQTMAYAHARGVIHRDLKPSNVMLGNFGEVQVMDWGLAKVLPRGGVVDDASTGKPLASESVVSTARSGRGADTDLSLGGVVLGTPSYMAPEQARGESDRLDERCDVFALGSILCEILTGKPAFSGRTSGEIHLKATEADLSEALARLDVCGADTELVALARDCLAVDLEQRPRDAGVVAARGLGYVGSLERRMRQAELERAAESARAEEAGHRVMVERQRRRYQLGLAASMVVLSMLGGLSFALWAQQRGARVTQAERALTDAITARNKAQETPTEPAAWEAAAKAVSDAARPVREAGVPEIEERLAVLRSEVRSQLEAARRDRPLLNAVANVRSSKQDLRHSGADAEYTRAFREAGLDIDGDLPEEVGAKLRARARVVDALVAALDDWALERRAGKQPASRWRRPLEVARAADLDPFRDRARAAFLQSDPKIQEKELRALAADQQAAQLQPPSALLLAAFLRDLKATDPALALLRAVAARHPDDIWANYELAATLVEVRPTARDEAVRYYHAARALRPETAHEFGHLLESMSREDEALAVFADLVERRPHDSRHLACYGNLLAAWRRPEATRIFERAVAEARVEVELKPEDALAHRNLGMALMHLRKHDESALEYQTAIRLEPDDPLNHYLLGTNLLGQLKLDEAASSYREAIQLKADYGSAHDKLASVLMAQQNFSLAVAECREAIRLKPEAAEFHVTLGLALSAMQKRDEAMEEIRLAQRLNPDYPEAHCSLGGVLSNLGDFAGAAIEARAGAALRSKRSGQPIFPEDRHWIASLDRQAAIVSRLPAIAKGDEPPDDIDEQLLLAEVAYTRKLFATAARLWSRAVDAKPELADDRKAPHRYNAACAAALAAAGQGKNEPCPDAAACVRLRRQALACLKMELAAWAKVLEFGNPQEVATIVPALQHWQEDADLVTIRDRAALDSLPADEQRAWRALWSEFGALLAKARACSKH
jgi:eukaryotic-like serine/threonine-protein kinase